jgi:hypothetical protein
VKNVEEEVPKTYFERNMIVVLFITALALGLDYLSYYVLSKPNPWGVLIAVPGLVFTIQALWLILNPYLLVFENRFEIKHSFYYNKEFFYLDIKSIELSKNKLIITYNDLEKEALPMFGMRESHKQKMFEELTQQINASSQNRGF